MKDADQTRALELQGAVLQGDYETANKIATFIKRAKFAAEFNELKNKLSNLQRYSSAFVHIPKCGGTSIKSSVFKVGGFTIGHRALASEDEFQPNDYYVLGDAPFISSKLLSSVPKLISVRNIYPFLTSYYFDAKRVIYANIADSIAANRYRFDDFIKYLSDKEHGWPCRHLLYFQCFEHPSGRLAVDWILRLEEAGSKFSAFCKFIGAAKCPTVEHKNKNTQGDYRTFYSDKAIGMVERTWADDIRLFGFSFDNGYSENAILNGDVRILRDDVNYSIADHRLSIAPSVHT